MEINKITKDVMLGTEPFIDIITDFGNYLGNRYDLINIVE